MDRTSDCRQVVAHQCRTMPGDSRAIGRTVENYVEQSQFWIEQKLETYSNAIRRGAVTAGGCGDGCTDRTPIPGTQNPSLKYLSNRAARPPIVNIQDNLDMVHMGDRRRVLRVPGAVGPIQCATSMRRHRRVPLPPTPEAVFGPPPPSSQHLKCFTQEQAHDNKYRIGGALRPGRLGNQRAASMNAQSTVGFGPNIRNTVPGLQTRASRRIRRPADFGIRAMPPQAIEPLPGNLHPPSLPFRTRLLPLPRWSAPPPAERI